MLPAHKGFGPDNRSVTQIDFDGQHGPVATADAEIGDPAGDPAKETDAQWFARRSSAECASDCEQEKQPFQTGNTHEASAIESVSPGIIIVLTDRQTIIGTAMGRLMHREYYLIR